MNPKPKIPFTDDDLNYSLLLKRILENEVTYTGNGALSLTSIRAIKPDPVLLDINIPEPNGHERHLSQHD